MGLGREVGDAYISVHGDLSDFRRDLDRAGGAVAEKAAMQAADDFSKAWEKRIKEDVNGKWDDILTAMYSNKQMDWDRLIGQFDSKNMDEAQSKILAFTDAMAKEGKLSTEQQEKFNKALQGTSDLMREQAGLDAAHTRALQDNAGWEQRRLDTMTAAEQENARWARTLDGMRKNKAIADMESDFRKMAETMSSMDMGKFASSFDNLHQARARVYEVTAAMEQQGRMSSEQSAIMHANINKFIDDEAAKAKAMRDTVDETNRLRAAQDKYNTSLNGMARTFHFGQLENDFRNLAAAMDSNDWSHFARGADDVEHMRSKISDTAAEMHRLGRMSDEEFAHITANVGNVTHAFGDAESAMGRSIDVSGRLKGAFSGLNGVLRGTREHLQGFAGLNVFSDMMQEGLDFIHNLDRIALKSSEVAVKLGSMASIGGSAIAGLFVIVQDLGDALGGLTALLPAFATGLGIMGYVGLTALQGMAKKYKKELGQWKEDMFKELEKGLQPALDRFSTVMLPTLKKNLDDTAAAEGRLFGAVLDGISASAGPQKMTTMFKRMNDAMDKSHAGVKSFINAWSTLGLTGSKYFDRFAGWINNMGASFDRFITKAAKSGQLDKWIESGITGLKDLVRALDGAFGIFNAIADAARAAGSGGLTEFADKLQGIAKAMQEQGFQTTLTTLFSGMRDAVTQIGDAVRGLGPAMQSVMPSVKTALGDIGAVAATIIGDIGAILSNPTVQAGITNFSSGMKTAIEHLAPAVKPFADSIGNALTLLGKVIVAVADIVTAFTVSLGPVLDQMSTKVQTLIQPLSGMAVYALTALKPVAAALDKYLVGPVVAALKSDLIPNVRDFIGKAGPFLTKIVEDLGPAFTILVKDVLPALVKVAGQLLPPMGKLVDLLSPTFAETLRRIAVSFTAIADALKVLNGEMPFPDLFKNAPTAADLEKKFREHEGAKMSWGEIFKELFWGGLQQGMADAWNKKIYPALAEAVAWLAQQVGIAMDKLFGSGQFWKDAKSNNMDLSRGLQELFADQGAKGAALDKTVNDWLDKNLVKPFQKGWDDAMKSLQDWWKGVKSNFQDFMSGLLGFDTHPGKEGSITGGGGAGGKGSAVPGTLDPAMFGLPTTEGVASYFTQLGTDIRTGFTSALTGLGDLLGVSDFPARWNEFWAGAGTTVSTAWTGIVTWITTKYTEISTNVQNFIATFGLNWNNFWTGVSTKVTQIWNAVSLWITTKVGEIRTNISGFITTVTGAWNGFWTGVGTKVSTTWAQITGWIGAQIGAIRGSISGFIGSVTGSWNGFWTGVGTRAQQAWTTVTNAVSAGVGNVVSYVQGIPGKVTGALGDGWGILQGAGAAIMGGLKRGLENAWGGVQQFVGTIAQWIADHKGPISYDRTLLVPAGEAIMGGLESSLRSGFTGVMGTVSTMADLVAGAFEHSKMYLAGADAARGLADGLASEKTTVLNALGAITPDSALSAKISAAAPAWGVGAPTPPVESRTITVEKGAINIVTPTESPDLVANKAIDALVSATAF